MRTSKLMILACLTLAVAPTSPDVSACGDKFIVAEEGMRNEAMLQASKPGRVLLYRPEAPDAAACMRDPELRASLEKAGHTVVVADGDEALSRALASERFDVVLVEYAKASDVRDTVKGNSASPVVVPVLDRTARQFLSAARREFKIVLNVPASAYRVVMALDKAMARS
jgi:hypothetical protein